METRDILEDIIVDFSPDKFVRFFREKNRSFAPRKEELAHYDDENFKDGVKLGEIKFSSGGKLIICAFQASQPLSERSGKKAQYEKGKKTLKDSQSDAGIFIFYEPWGNFRFSLIYANYLGKKRDWSTFRRFTYFVSKDFTNKTFLQRIADGDFSSLEKIKDAFSVEKVTKDFYTDIANWYFGAVKKSLFPDDAERLENGRNIAVIRLITRIIFIWFMKVRGLVPDELFNEDKIKEILVDISPNEATYYKAILQNLFFATLNTKQEQRKFRAEVRGYKGYNPDFGNHGVYRHLKLFKNPESIEEYFGKIPFLNGGLFECLDYKSKLKEERVYIDGFTDTAKHQPFVPNFLLFSGETETDLNKKFGTKNKSYKIRGLIDILSSYNFTIDENEPDDQEIALDPELLGRVFENLLASYNPETATTARKATGSYYTPRKIVDYMVTQSLIQYFKSNLPDDAELDTKLSQLFSTESLNNPFDADTTKQIIQLIESLRIVDPAVGSGAFPMGTLNKLVFILSKLDPQNILWKQAQVDAIKQNVTDPIVQKRLILQVEKQFEDKNADYGRKLYLIEKCIYGVDIQQIAVEIAKLRFFISLLVDEKIDFQKYNYDIEPLPNLDFKLMQGNSLISSFAGIDFDRKTELKEQGTLQLDTRYDHLIKQFEEAKNQYQNEPDKNSKDALRNDIEDLLIQIFEEKIKQHLPQLKNIEEIYAKMPNQKQRIKLIATEKQKVCKKLGFDLEQAEKDLIAYTEGRKPKDFFLWNIYFAEVFYKKDGFDVVIANPPYVRADSPEIKQQRRAIKKSNAYKTLWEKWDLYVAFIEKGFNILADKGILEFIIPDAYMSSKYSEKSHDYFLNNAVINRINFCSELKIFEAAVKNIIIEYKKEINPNHIPLRIKHIDEWDNFIYLPSKKQSEMGENTFKLDSENKTIGDLSNTLTWGEICYVSYGVAQSSDEIKYKGEFTKEDVLSDIKDKTHPFGYIEGKYIDKYVVKKIRYIEWGTERSPEKWRRVTFSELYKPEKIMHGGMTGAILDKENLMCNHSMTVSVLWKDLENVKNRSIEGSIKKDFKIKKVYPFRNKLEENSKLFNLKYLLAILNSKFAYTFLNSVRRSQIGFYPDDLKRLPILKIPLSAQQPFITLVDQILAAKKKDPNADTSALEKQIDEMVYDLYGLTPEEIAIVRGKG